MWGPFLMTAGAFVIGVPVYLAQRSHMAEPEPVPDQAESIVTGGARWRGGGERRGCVELGHRRPACWVG